MVVSQVDFENALEVIASRELGLLCPSHPDAFRDAVIRVAKPDNRFDMPKATKALWQIRVEKDLPFEQVYNEFIQDAIYDGILKEIKSITKDADHIATNLSRRAIEYYRAT